MLIKNTSENTIYIDHPDTGEHLAVAPNEEVDLPRWYAQNLIPPRKKDGVWQRV